MKGFTWNSKAVLQFFQKNRWTALLLLVGLALLLWPAGGTGDNNTPAATEQRQQYAYDLESLEEKLANTLSQVEGAGRTQVVLTLATTGSVELAENQTSKDGSVETQVVVVKRGSNQEDVVEVAQQYPAFLRGRPAGEVRAASSGEGVDRAWLGSNFNLRTIRRK